jgi:ATP-dependent helicase/nuclease subunit A
VSNLTPEQQQVVTTLGKNLLVSASAGSGKTHTMIERIFYLIKEQKVSIKDMLIVTFTNAAASEMKQKIYEKLAENAESSEHIKEELNSILTADISTLHTFCSKIIKQHFYEVGVDPAFKVLEEKEALVLINDSLNAVINSYIRSGDAEFNLLFETYNKKRRDAEYKQSVLSLYNFLKTKHDYKTFVKVVIEKTYNDDLKDNLAAKYLNTLLNELIEHFNEVFKKLAIEAEQQKSQKLLEVANSTLSIISVFSSKNTFETNAKLLANLDNFARMPGKVADDEVSLKEQIASAKTELKNKLDNFKEIYLSNTSVKKTLQKAKINLLKMLEVVNAFDEHYKEVKKDKALLDFNDLEHYTLEVLKNDALKESIKNRYKYVFIDEYQDTNNLQEQILSNIVSANNAFMVGDVKQSIYMFRECDPQIFVDKYEKYKNDEHSLKIDLNANFRSEKTILDFANFVFKNIMTPKTASVDYKNTASFVTGAKYLPSSANLPLVSVNVINSPDLKEELEELEASEQSLKVYSVAEHIKQLNQKENTKPNLALVEARLAASKIKEFLNSQIYDAKAGEYRKVKYSDIAILTRVKGDYIRTVCEELANLGVPINAKYYDKIYDTLEASLINNYLKLINNRQDDLALVSVLASSMFEVSYEELSEIRIAKQDKKFFYQAVAEFIVENKNLKISTKILKLFADLEEFRAKLSYLTVPELMQEVIRRYNLENYFLALPNGKERLANLKLVINASKKPQLVNNLYKYIDYIETFGQNEEFEINTSTSAESVTITTIHASKGLEYPIVILINAGRDFTKKPATEEILINKDLGFGARYYDLVNRTREDTIVRDAIKLKNKEQEQAEEMRLFYVAITRAKNHLVLIGKTNLEKQDNINSVYSIKNAKSYMEWVLGSLPYAYLNSLKSGKKELDLNLDENTSCKFEICNLNKLEEDSKVNNPIVFAKPSKVYKEQLMRVFNFKYAHTNSSEVATKSSVTEVMQGEDDEPSNYSIKKFRLDEVYKTSEELDFSKIGSAYHSVLEHISFELKTLSELKEQIKFLINNNTLPIDTLELVELEKILRAILAVAELLKGAKEVKREQQFMMYVPYNEVFKDSEISDKILIQGVIDLIVIKDDEVIIVDYKTSRIKDSKKLAEKYRVQLELYKKAYELATGRKVSKKLIYSFYLNNMVNV